MRISLKRAEHSAVWGRFSGDPVRAEIEAVATFSSEIKEPFQVLKFCIHVSRGFWVGDKLWPSTVRSVRSRKARVDVGLPRTVIPRAAPIISERE